MKKCFGIISWLPDGDANRKLRKERLNRLLKQLEHFWPEVPVLIITQNWKTSKLPKITNEIIRRDFEEGLGILKARKTLQEEFLKLDFDYIIMFDDDAIIEETSEDGAKQFMAEIDKHPDGFCFLQYKAAQLNGCAISKKIYQQEKMVNVDPQKDEAYEDTIYSYLLHYKYTKDEFANPHIKCTQFKNPDEPAKSTWAGTKHQWAIMWANTEKILNYMEKNKDFPSDWRSFCVLVKKKNTSKTYLGYSDYFGL